MLLSVRIAPVVGFGSGAIFRKPFCDIGCTGGTRARSFPHPFTFLYFFTEQLFQFLYFSNQFRAGYILILLWQHFFARTFKHRN